MARLGVRERGELVTALQSVISRGEYQQVGNFHGSPMNICGTSSCCPHGTPDFLPWHRLYMVQMEEALGEPLPYWDWTRDSQLPSLWEGVRAPIREGHQSLGGPDCPTGDPQFVRRNPNTNLNVNLLRDLTMAAFMETDFEGFSAAISQPHNLLHVSVGCDMSTLETAAYDPIFYLHHAYVDRQFAFWQELQRLRGLAGRSNDATLATPLRPFNIQRHNSRQRTLQNNRGTETFDYRENFCYEYDDLRFMNLSPSEFLASANGTTSVIPLEGTSASRRTARVYMGVVLPKMAPSGLHLLQLCLAARCVPAGQVATFGARDSRVGGSVSSKTHYITEVEVTRVVEEQGWEGEEVEARVESRLLPGLPPPVVVRRFTGGEGEVRLGQLEEEVYGDLLDKYTIVDGIV